LLTFIAAICMCVYECAKGEPGYSDASLYSYVNHMLLSQSHFVFRVTGVCLA